MNSETKELIYNKYILPTEQKRYNYVGIEIELPVVSLHGGATDHSVSQEVFRDAAAHFGFTPCKYDDNVVCHEAADDVTGDILSFDCSYNNLEISFGKEKSLTAIDERFKKYISYLNLKLKEKGHIITGMGINPYYNVCRRDYLPSPRYKMLEGYLQKSLSWEGSFHKYPAFGTFASASQIQLDVDRNDLSDTIRIFSLLEPFKTVLFANSVLLYDEPQLLCARDMLWESSTHGINPHNVGMYEAIPETAGELAEYIASTGIFCTMRGDKYLFFYPIPFSEYLDREWVEGEYYKDGEYHREKFKPCAEDIEYLRSYKFIELTARGTIEYRSVCTQPLSEALAPSALQLGLTARITELGKILERDTSLYHHGFSATELRALMNREEMPEFADRKKLADTLTDIVNLAENGLKSRGYGEEKYLKPVKRRAKTLMSPAREMKERLRAGENITDIIASYALLN